MPRFVRPFYIFAKADGIKTKHNFGPKTKSGGIDVVVYQRSNGMITKGLEIVGRVDSNGEISLSVIDNGTVVYEKNTSL